MEKLIGSRHFTIWQLIKIYWQSQNKRKAYLWYLFLMVLTILVVVTEVLLTYWSNYFYDALQAYNEKAALRLLGFFFLLAFCYIIFVVGRYYLTQLFSLHWRKWLTRQCIGRWLDGKAYYYLETFDEKTDNPDQRIQDDVGALVTNSLDLSLSFFGNVLSFIGFSYVLWSLSGDLTIPLGPLGTYVIHRYLLWVSVLYTIVGTVLTFKLGRPLIRLISSSNIVKQLFVLRRSICVNILKMSHSIAVKNIKKIFCKTCLAGCWIIGIDYRAPNKIIVLYLRLWINCP